MNQKQIDAGRELSSKIIEINKEPILNALKDFDRITELVYSPESGDTTLDRMLDFTGIDLIVKREDGLLGGVAFRTNRKPYENLTLRDNGKNENSQLRKLLRAQGASEPFLQAVYYVQLNGVDESSYKLKQGGNILVATASQIYQWISSLTLEEKQYLYFDGEAYSFMRVPSEADGYWKRDSPLYRYAIE